MRRKLLTPAFCHEMLHDSVAVINEHAAILARVLREQARKWQPFNIGPHLSACAIDIISETALGKNVGAQSGPGMEYVLAQSDAAQLIFKRVWMPFIYYKTSDGKRMAKALKILHDFTNKGIKERQLCRDVKESDTADSVTNASTTISAYYYPVTPKGQTTPTSNRFSPLASLMESKEHDVAQAGVVTTGSATPTQHLSPGTQLPTTQTDQHVMQGNAQPMHQWTESGDGRPLPDLGQAGSSSVTFIAQTELSTQPSNQGGPPPGLMQMQGQSYMQAGASQGLQIQPQLGIPAGHVQPGIQMQQSGQAQMHNGTQQQYHQLAGNVAQMQQPNGQPQTYYNSSNGSNSDPAAGTMNQQHRQPPTITRPMKRSYPGDDPMLEARFMAIEYNVQQGHITQNRAEEDLNSNKVRICPCPYRVPATHDQLTKWYKDTFADKIAAPPGIDLCPPGTTFQQVNLPNARGPARENLKMVVMVEFPTSLVPNFYKAWKWDGEGKGGLQLIADAHKNYERVEKAKGDVNDHAKHGFCLPKNTSVHPQLPTRHNLCCKYVKDLIRAMVKVMQERDGGNTSVGAPWMNRSGGRLPQLQPSRQGQDLKIRILITPVADGQHPVYKNKFVNYDQLQMDTRTAPYTVALGKQPTNVTGKIYDFKKQHELMDEARQVVGTRQRELSPAHVPYQPNPPNQGYSQAEFVNNDPNIPPVSY